MGKRSKTKGQAGEREVCKILRGLLGTDARRTAQTDGSLASDLNDDALPGVHIEVKRYARIGVCRFHEQAERDAESQSGSASVPALVYREDRGQWYVSVPLSRVVEFADRVAEATGLPPTNP